MGGSVGFWLYVACDFRMPVTFSKLGFLIYAGEALVPVWD